MWRAVFLAVGITLCIIGLECFFVEKAVLADSPKPMPRKIATSASALLRPRKEPEEITTKEWMPWSFLSGGVIIILYTITLPNRLQGD